MNGGRLFVRAVCHNVTLNCCLLRRPSVRQRNARSSSTTWVALWLSGLVDCEATAE